jgi:HD-GYP domain-containing protein (c-di-GMP phosphodiesterase class II)
MDTGLSTFKPDSEEAFSSTRALAELIGLASRLNSARSTDELLSTFSRGLLDIWPGTGVRLCEIHTNAKCLVPLESSGDDPIPLRGSFLGNVASDRIPSLVPNLELEPAYIHGREAPSGINWKSAIACPIKLESSPAWVIGVFFPNHTNADESDLTLLERAISILEPLLRRWEDQSVRLTAFRDIARAIASAVDARDPHLVGHGGRVSEFAAAIARVHGLNRDFIERLSIAGLLHDVGRLGIPESVMSKPGPLTPEEFRVIRAHAGLSEKFLDRVDYLADVLPAIRHHHERYDGAGYPEGIEGDEIPLAARILCVADAFDAMTSPRPFRAPMTDADAIAELKKESGSQFDPIIVESFLRAYEEKIILSQNVLRSDDPLAEIRIIKIS